MRFAIVGEGPLAQGCAEAIAGRQGWALTEAGADVIVLCGPASGYACQASEAARRGIRVLCPTPLACGGTDSEAMLALARSGMVRALRPELQRPHVSGLRQALDGPWLGPVGAVDITRKRPLVPGRDRCGGALAQCAMEEVSAVVWLLGVPQRLFCVCTALGEGEQVSLTLQQPDGALVNIQAVLGGFEETYFNYEYAGRYGLADYDSRRGALDLTGGRTRLAEEDWTADRCGRALERALTAPDGNGCAELLRIQLAALLSCRERRVVELGEVEP